MKKIGAEQHERFLFAILLLIGTLLMLIAGQFALRMPSTWQISDTNMDSKLNPNEVYVLYHGDPDLRLVPIRTDIPNLLATVSTNNTSPESILPPPAVEFKAPAQIATTTPFQMNLLTVTAVGTAVLPTANATSTAAGTVTAAPASTATLAPTEIPTQRPWPTSTVRRIPTRTARPARTATPVTPATPTNVVVPDDPDTPTATLTPALAPTHTPTHTPAFTPTATATATAAATGTPTATATATDIATPISTATVPTLDPCTSNGGNNYIVPVGGCTFAYNTTALGGIFSLEMVGSGNLSINWFGLLEDETLGTCSDQNSNLTPGIQLTHIAVAKGTNTLLIINNSNNKPIEIKILVSDWLTGGCQPGS